MRKNLATKHDASNMIISIAVVGTICILLAFFYFWYFPSYVSSAISYLATRMRELLKSAGVSVEMTGKDEVLVLSQSIRLLEGKLTKIKKRNKKAEA